MDGDDLCLISQRGPVCLWRYWSCSWVPACRPLWSGYTGLEPSRIWSGGCSCSIRPGACPCRVRPCQIWPEWNRADLHLQNGSPWDRRPMTSSHGTEIGTVSPPVVFLFCSSASGGNKYYIHNNILLKTFITINNLSII